MRGSTASNTRARRATTSTAWTCTTERAGRREGARVGPACTAGPLAARVPDRLQLVVGPQPPYGLAHLVGLRDPDPAHLQTALGLLRQLDCPLRELRSGA